jgi:alkyl sulfatase BDS1-like metallo-beta-lactamase superfamily hydrolase
LRHGVFQLPVRIAIGADTLAGLSSDIFFDLMAIRLDPAKAAGQSMVINWQFTDRDEKLALTLKHSTLTYRLGEWSDKATASVVTTRDTLDAMVLGKLTAPQAMQAGKLTIEGDPSRLALLFTVVELAPNPLMFDILTPGEGRAPSA